MIVLLINFTFAKYERAAGSEKANLKFQVSDGFKTSTKKISLIDTASLASGVIAPGAKGEFEIELAASQLDDDLEYCIEAKESKNRPVNFVFRVNESKKEYSSLQELAAQELTGKIAKDDSQSRKFMIFWEWPYESGNTEEEKANADQQDTDLGTGEQAGVKDEFDYSFTLKVIGNQA